MAKFNSGFNFPANFTFPAPLMTSTYTWTPPQPTTACTGSSMVQFPSPSQASIPQALPRPGTWVWTPPPAARPGQTRRSHPHTTLVSSLPTQPITPRSYGKPVGCVSPMVQPPAGQACTMDGISYNSLDAVLAPTMSDPVKQKIPTFSATPMALHTGSPIKSHRVGSPQPSTSGLSRRRQKRKSSDGVNGCQGAKIFVNEERMAASLQELSLAADATAASTSGGTAAQSPLLSSWLIDDANPQEAQRILDEIDSRLSTEDLDDSDSEIEEYLGENNNNIEQVQGPRLEFAKDLNLELQNKEILPDVLLEQLSKPPMEVVLWKPPGTFVKDVVAEVTSPKTTQQETSTENVFISSTEDTSSGPNQLTAADDNNHLSVVKEVHPDVIVEDMFDSMDDEMEL